MKAGMPLAANYLSGLLALGLLPSLAAAQYGAPPALPQGQLAIPSDQAVPYELQSSYGQPYGQPIGVVAPAGQVTPVQYPAPAQSQVPSLASSTNHVGLPTATQPLITPPGNLVAQPGEHPLAPAVRWAKQGLADINRNIQDYSCTLVKRERVGGELGEHEYLFCKVRHQPFSVYMYFLGPAAVKGQEALYVDGKNDGNLLAHPTGIRQRLVGTVALNPLGPIAMSGQRYPITHMGFRRLVERLVEVGEHDMQYGECEVRVIPGAKINDRDSLCVEVRHPTPRKEFIFALARIFVDTETNLPVRYEAYEWAPQPNQDPLLVEEYTFLDIKVNQGFTDLDFDSNNPNYNFK